MNPFSHPKSNDPEQEALITYPSSLFDLCGNAGPSGDGEVPWTNLVNWNAAAEDRRYVCPVMLSPTVTPDGSPWTFNSDSFSPVTFETSRGSMPGEAQAYYAGSRGSYGDPRPGFGYDDYDDTVGGLEQEASYSGHQAMTTARLPRSGHANSKSKRNLRISGHHHDKDEKTPNQKSSRHQPARKSHNRDKGSGAAAARGAQGSTGSDGRTRTKTAAADHSPTKKVARSTGSASLRGRRRSTSTSKNVPAADDDDTAQRIQTAAIAEKSGLSLRTARRISHGAVAAPSAGPGRRATLATTTESDFSPRQADCGDGGDDGAARSRRLHNAVEKQYRQRLNSHFERLLSTLPNESDIDDDYDDYDDDDDGAKAFGRFDVKRSRSHEARRLSKCEVLNKSMSYIKRLENEQKELEENNEKLRGAIDGMLQNNKGVLTS